MELMRSNVASYVIYWCTNLVFPSALNIMYINRPKCYLYIVHCTYCAHGVYQSWNADRRYVEKNILKENMYWSKVGKFFMEPVYRMYCFSTRNLTCEFTQGWSLYPPPPAFQLRLISSLFKGMKCRTKGDVILVCILEVFWNRCSGPRATPPIPFPIRNTWQVLDTFSRSLTGHWNLFFTYKDVLKCCHTHPFYAQTLYI